MKNEKKTRIEESGKIGSDEVLKNNYSIQLFKSSRNQFHETPKNLIEIGMCLCDTCGEVCSLEDDTCNTCGQEIVIFKTK